MKNTAPSPHAIECDVNRWADRKHAQELSLLDKREKAWE